MSDSEYSTYTYSDSNSSHFSIPDIQLEGVEMNKRYGVIKRIGYGSFSTVWMAYDYVLNKLVAIKVMNEDDYYTGKDEVEIHKTLLLKNGKYLNHMIDNFEYNKQHICIVYELYVGSVTTLFKYYPKGLPEVIAKDIIKQTLKAMKELNEAGFKHTDIKPENILLVGKTKMMDDILRKAHSSGKLKRGSLLKELIKVANKEIYTNEEHIDDVSYLKEPIKIKLTDFGTCRKLNHITYEIQTRYYRSPDVILQYNCDKTCDIWSVGCMLYNLLTNEDLFDPPESDTVTCDRAHIYMMYSRLGTVPDELINVSLKKDVFFTKNNLLKGVRRVDYIHLNQPEHAGLTDNNCTLIYQMLEYDPKKRKSIDELLTLLATS